MKRILLLLALFSLVLATGAQEPASPPPQKPQASAPATPATPTQENGDQYKLKRTVELVTAPLVVRDSSGQFVYDIQRSEVAVYDNGVPQQLTSFELATQPVSLVILLDTSQRVSPLLDRMRDSGILFTSYILGPDGEAAVLTFDNDVIVRQKFTSDDDKIIRAVGNIRVGGSRTRLANAMDRAVTMLMERPQGRRRIIVAITDAEDDGSQVPVGLPLRRAQVGEISVYTISLSPLEADVKRKASERPVQSSPYPPGVFPGPPVPGQVQTPGTEAQLRSGQIDLLAGISALVTTLHNTTRRNPLELYAAGTGGLNFSQHSQAGLETALNEIGQDLHNQYLVSYRPSNNNEFGFHQIEIKVSRPGVTVRTRPGYYIGTSPS